MTSFDDPEVLVRERTLLGLSGGPSPDFNMCLVDDSPNLERTVGEAIERIQTRGLSAVFMVSALASKRLGDPERMGLVAVGEAPLMVYAGSPPAVDPRYELIRASTPLEMHEVADLIAKAFELDRGWIGRTFASVRAIECSCGADYFLVRNADEPVSTITFTGAGPLLGIWSMATDPRFQRRGAGRAALLGAIAQKQALGARSFYLIATEAGKPLYDGAGFVTVESFPMYALVASGSASR